MALRRAAEDRRVVGRPFDAMVERTVHIGAVAVLLAVRLVVLDVVGDEVVECEAVVGGDEVHAGERTTILR